jgi:hypothetical protein
VRQVEWGTYEVILDGTSTSRLLCRVLDDDTWRHEPVEVVNHGAGATGLGHIEMGTVVDLLDAGRYYSLVADVY